MPDETLLSKPFVRFQDATVRIRDRHILAGTSWQISAGQQWAVIGPNGSGKSTLIRALCGLAPVVRGTIRRQGPFSDKRRIGYVSFELQQHIMARENMRDAARTFSGRLDEITTAAEVIANGSGDGSSNVEHVRYAASMLAIENLLKQDIRGLSSGEMRKVLIARALAKKPVLLVLDEPFEGLDGDSARLLVKTLEGLIRSGLQLVLVTHRFEAVGTGITHVMALKDCRVAFQGSREKVMTTENLERIYRADGSRPEPLTGGIFPTTPPRGAPLLIDMRSVTVAYGRRVVLNGIDWKVRQGEHWAVLGPNGAGKSTLLSLVSQDHPQAYANEIYLFGRRKGSGETLGEIKRHIGVVSSRFQNAYRKHLRVMDVVVSGFFDTIGLYRRPAADQQVLALQLLRRLELQDLAYGFFDQLSYGQQRLILIARAVIKSPLILVLDEPCQGLDPYNRQRVATMLEIISADSGTTLLYATHHRDELPGRISHLLVLDGRGRVSVQSPQAP